MPQRAFGARGTLETMAEVKQPRSEALTVPGTGVTYSSYLQLEELLALQKPRSEPAEHDELLFITVHQVYELWFKQVLHELDFLERNFEAGDPAIVLSTFKRILTILKTLVAQVDVLETMTPIDFASFRSRLESASGFQSLQFRLIEIKLGKRDERLKKYFANDPATLVRLDSAFAAPSLYQRFLAFIRAQGIAVGDDEKPALIHVYRKHRALSAVCERMVDLDEGIQEWRYRHVRMVERTIGLKRGTGGSAGASYLRTTLFEPLFPELWAIRSEL